MLAQGCIVPTPLQESQGSDSTYNRPVIVPELTQPPFGPLNVPNTTINIVVTAEDPFKDAIVVGQIFRNVDLVPVYNEPLTLLREGTTVRFSATFTHNLCAEGFHTGDLVFIVVNSSGFVGNTAQSQLVATSDANHWELTCF